MVTTSDITRPAERAEEIAEAVVSIADQLGYLRDMLAQVAQTNARVSAGAGPLFAVLRGAHEIAMARLLPSRSGSMLLMHQTRR